MALDDAGAGGAPPRFSVVVPTLGSPEKLDALLGALESQTYPRARWELIVCPDGAPLSTAVSERVARLGGRSMLSERRHGPGAARNRGAAAARGEFLAFTEDDCTPEPDWLEHAAAHLDRDATTDVIVGETLKPDGRPVRRSADGLPHYLPTNLFVRRAVFERAGGYGEAFFDADTGAYFREDSDLGFTLESLRASIELAGDVRVVHPAEHAAFLDPLRWAARYEMDPLLAARHPERFRDRIEVHRLGPFRVRRPIVRASLAYLVALAAAIVAALAGAASTAGGLLVLAVLALLPLAAKWRFAPARLLLVPLVPFALAAALARGRARLGRANVGAGTTAGRIPD